MKLFIVGKVDVLIITETKLDSTFLSSQFCIFGFSKPFRFDRNRKGGGVMVFIREDIPCKELFLHKLPNDIEGIFLELNLRKSKWLIFATYHPPNQNDTYYFQSVSFALDTYSKLYDKFLLAGDFNSEDSELALSTFLEKYDAKNIVKDKTCYKSLQNPSCIDLFISNSPKSFMKTITICTGLSDFHKMVITVLKSSFKKAPPREISYRDYKNFDRDTFRDNLKEALKGNINGYQSFEEKFIEILGNQAPIKRKVVRANHATYMTKVLRKAIMKRSELKTKYLKKNTQNNLKAYKKQRNYCSKLYKKEKKKYYNNLNVTQIKDNREFWKNVKPFLSDKGGNFSRITLVNENDEIVCDDLELANTFSDHFETAVTCVNVDNPNLSHSLLNSTNQIQSVISKFESHPSILKIKECVNLENAFNFEITNKDEISEEISNLDNKKNGTYGNIPTKIIKDNYDICSSFLENIWNKEMIHDSVFQDKLKLADVTPVYKKKDKTSVENYRPISVLPTFSKVFEKLIQKQITAYIENILSPYICGYRKGFSTQNALVLLIERWKKELDAKGYSGAILMDLSKAFDTINHELLIAKLNAYGFSEKALALILSYLTNRWQRVKINTSFSSWKELTQGVPQGSVLGPLLFNIYLNDLFMFLNEVGISNYADDTTLYVCSSNLKNVIEKLEQNSEVAIFWFESNFMQLNTEKCKLIVSGLKHEQIWANIGDDVIWESKDVELLGITLDSELKFEKHISKICSKAHQKISILSRMAKFLTLNKKRILFKAFFESQFQYCPLVWMFQSRAAQTKINALHERALRITYNNYYSTFEELLEKDGSVTIHISNIRKLVTEIYKVFNDLGNDSYLELLQANNSNYNLRNQNDLKVPTIKTVWKGENSIRFLGAVLWNLLPNEIKSAESLSIFKAKIKNWQPLECPCRLCKNYINGVGFVTISN